MMKRPFEAYLLYVLLAVLAVNALFAGGAMILSPGGSELGLPLDWISGTPFKSYLIPGILLFFFLGVLPAITLAGLITRKQVRIFQAMNLYPDMHWSWTFSLCSGIVTIIWILVQQLMTDYFILQPIVTAIGLLLLILTLLPRIRAWYHVPV